jgi:nitrogen fixation/metabolism regulation signal transduction histidine kinase
MTFRNPAMDIALRAVLMAGLISTFISLAAGTQLYATMLVVLVAAGLVFLDIRRIAARFRVERTDSPIVSDSARLARDLQYAEALLDTVSAALVVVTSRGPVKLINRAARALAAVPISNLHEISGLGQSAVDAILALPVGARQVVHSAAGQPLHVSVLQFRAPGLADERLISLQRITGELDAVEVKAWQDVASVLTHEIMNSLTPIASLSESLEDLLRDTAPRGMDLARNEEISGALEAIKRRSQGLMSFVERYRSVAQIPEPYPREIEAREFFAGIGRLMSATLRERGIEFENGSGQEELRFIADADLLEQAVINLLRNAVDAASVASKEKRPRVRLACTTRGDEVVIAVADNGPGLDSAEQDRIFVPFFTTKANGKGIGLSLARHVALAHGGRIEVESDSANGTVFSLILPAAAAAAPGARSIGQ